MAPVISTAIGTGSVLASVLSINKDENYNVRVRNEANRNENCDVKQTTG